MRFPCLFCTLLFSAIFICSSNTFAQSGIATSASKSHLQPNTNSPTADFSESIDPQSVKTYSDEQLNETFDKMSLQYSKNAVLFNNIGATYYTRKMYDKAESALRRAIILNNHPAFLVNLSILYDSQGRLTEAVSAAQRAVMQAPRYGRARTQLCELMLVAKRNSDTVLCYDELAKIAPLDSLAQTYYALATLKSGDADRAISLISPLLKGQQTTPLMFDVLGFAFYQKKKFAQASNAFRQGVELDPDSSQLRFNLAMSLTGINDRAGALSQYKLMKDKSPVLADQLYRALYRDKIIYVDGGMASKKP